MSDVELKKFQRTREDFMCGKCGFAVEGNGYTNHCPRCLWSKHVDVNPGDRQERCGGMMEPISVEQKSGRYQITHRCTACGLKRNCKTWAEDSIDRLVELSARLG